MNQTGMLLLGQTQLGPMQLRNRIVVSAMNTNYPTPDGAVTDRQVEFYRVRAKGGAGLIITGMTYVHPLGRGPVRMLGSHDDALIPGLRRFTDAIHEEGAKAALQLAHVGRRASSKLIGAQPVGPSPIAAMGGEVPHELTHAEIEELVGCFGQAARRAKEAGFDAVELHMAHGYLLSQFLSPYSNKRTDEYGGSVENRARFPLAVLRRVLREVGDSMAVLCKINGSDFVEGGITLEDAKATARLLEEAGAHGLDVSASTDTTVYMGSQPAAIPRGCLVPLAEGIKSVVNIPVIAVGRINDPALAEDILATGKADLVAMGRALITDPDLPAKVAAGHLEDIRICYACCDGCSWRNQRGLEMSCSCNAQAGYELERRITPTASPRHVVVVGGGPAGLEAARVAALRGHKVTLYEKEPAVGGLLNAGSVPPYKDELRTLVQYFANQMDKLGVEVHTGEAATVEALAAARPDVVVVATGGQPFVLPVEGNGTFALLVADVLTGKAAVGKRVAIIGGNSAGCEAAEYLAEKGHNVTVLEMMDDYATDVRPDIKQLLGGRLAKLGVNISLGVKVTAVRRGEVVYEKAGNEETLTGVDNVVFAMGSSPDSTFLEGVRARGLEAHAVGDCDKPGNIFSAVHGAFLVASQI